MAERGLPQPTLQEIVNRARILVIDDEDFAYSTLFRRDGYTIAKWRDVTKLAEIEQGKHDIILLDLQGIGKKISQDQGLGVLRHIKEVRPSQVVVAYSNADWPVKYQPFFEMADEVLPKSADYVTFKKVVDDLLQEHFSVGFHLSAIDEELARYGADDWWTRRTVRKAVTKRNTDGLQKRLRRRGLDQEKISNILALVDITVGVAQIWMS